MVRGRISKKTKERFRKGIQDVIIGLSSKVLVYKNSIDSECSNCFFDKSTNSSTNTCKWTSLEASTKQSAYEISSGTTDLKYKYFKFGRCPVCNGKGFLSILRSEWVNCLVIWNPKDRGNESIYTPAGLEGATVVQLKTDPKYLKLFNNCSKVVVDGVDCKTTEPLMIRGLGNDSVLVITLFSDKGLQFEKEPLLKNYFDG